MNHFKIFAHGESFDVDVYLAKSSLQFDHIWRRGDQRRYACVESRHETSGVERTLGDGSKIPIHEQDRIAVEFLSVNRDLLNELAKFPGVDNFILGLHYQIELDPGTIGFCLSPSAQLMWHALEIGIEPTFYVVLDRRLEWAAEGG
jgi:hypothetical protein